MTKQDHYIKVNEMVDHVAELAFKKVIIRLDKVFKERKDLLDSLNQLALENMALEENIRNNDFGGYKDILNDN